MGIRFESPVFGSASVDTGQLITSRLFKGRIYDFTLDGAGPGLGGQYFIRRRGRGGKVFAEGFIPNNKSKDIFIFGRSVTLTGN